MEAFLSEEEEFVENTVFDQEPVETDEGACDVLPGTLAAEFCTYWSLSKVLLGIPDRTPLQ